MKRNLKREKQIMTFVITSVLLALILAAMMLIITLVAISRNNQNEGRKNNMVYESTVRDNHNTVVPPANILPSKLNCNNIKFVNKQSNYSKIKYSKNWTDDEAYMLANIAMAEAEGESLETKVLVILTVLNRVQANEFPDTIREVIFQNRKGVYQFTPIADGRWDRVKPNDECWEAVNIVSQLNYDISRGALYFEACSGESWHSRNLELICQSDNTRFYK